MFGRKAPDGAVVSWGARAIYDFDLRHGWQIDLLWDRQQATGSEAHRALLQEFLNKYALPRLRAECRLGPDSQEVFSFDEGGWHVEASTQASHGYLYIGAWPLADVPEGKPPKYKAPPKPRLPKARPKRLVYPRDRFS
jgi:hypothetical protein